MRNSLTLRALLRMHTTTCTLITSGCVRMMALLLLIRFVLVRRQTLMVGTRFAFVRPGCFLIQAFFHLNQPRQFGHAAGVEVPQHLDNQIPSGDSTVVRAG